MVHPLAIKLKFITCLFFAVIFVFCFHFQTQANLAPGIFVTELRIDGVIGNEIKGEFVVVNSEKYYLNNLNYEVKLLQGNSFKEFKLVDVNISKDTFFVPPEGSITKSFAYVFPQNIVSGDYTLRVQAITDRGDELGWKDEKISLQGQNKFLDILYEFSRVLVGKEEAFPLTGINVLPTDDVVDFLKVKNSGEAITVVPKIKIFQRQVNMPIVKEYDENPITFAKNETREINLAMPKLDIPESYLAEVKFYQGDEQVSGIQYFRWVVRGDGGKILYLKTDKDYYGVGDNMNIGIDSVGPADASDAGTGKLEITVTDKDGNLIGETSKDVLLKPMVTSSLATIPIKKDLLTPRVNVKLTKDGKVLDESAINLPKFSEEAKTLEQEILERAKMKKFLIYLSLSMAALILIMIVGFLVYKFKIKRKQ